MQLPPIPRFKRSFAADLLVFLAVFAVLYAVMTLARSSFAPSTPAAISLRLSALPEYAAFSLLRISAAYGLSLIFTLIYGYIAAYHSKAERLMIPLLDILQSIPVLSFLPPVMLAMVSLFPNRRLGVELGSILLIFTGQAWNMTFSFYSSLKTIPRELREATWIYRFSWWQRFTQLELPYSTIGLVWNSMMSVAGGWFFLMACETFFLGKRDFRLPGLGSYLQKAAEDDNKTAILFGMATMIGLVVILDQLVWRPVIAWAGKFKFEQTESVEPDRSALLTLLRRSTLLTNLNRLVWEPLSEKLTMMFVVRFGEREGQPARWRQIATWILVVLAALLVGNEILKAGLTLAQVSRADLRELVIGLGATLLRVTAALVIGAAWTLPVGVAIGFNPRLARFLQPMTQVAASVPATALFPVVILVLVRFGGGFGIASLILMLLGTQWYILFNVIAGAMAIPADLREAAQVFRFSLFDRWRLMILPGIFPYFVTGMLTAAGGAWNASIVAEYFHFQGTILSTTGLGAIISQASDTGNFSLLLAATVVMAVTVVSLNRLIWRRLYSLAETRFRLDG